MATPVIVDNPDRAFVSYGYKVKIKQTDDLTFRNKLGVHVYVDDIIIGSVEVDIFAKDVIYEIEIGEVIKLYMNKQAPVIDSWVTDNIGTVKLTPYSKYRQIEGEWQMDTGAVAQFAAIRGIHHTLYSDGDYTPQEPDGSIIFENFPTNGYKVILPPNSYRNIYVHGYTTDTTYTNVTVTAKEYGIDDMLNESQVGSTSIYGGNSDLTKNMLSCSLHATKVYPDGLTPSRKHLRIQKEVRSKADNTVITRETYHVYVEYKCIKEWDYQLALLYLGHNFMWNSIPFYLKNDNTLDRTNNTFESYKYKRTDYNLKVRRTFNLKSDFLPRDVAEEAVFLATSENVMVKFDKIDAPQDARIVTNSLTVHSPHNEGMVQIEVSIELSDIIPTP